MGRILAAVIGVILVAGVARAENRVRARELFKEAYRNFEDASLLFNIAQCERQLGYKHAKYVMRIELVQSFDKIAGGKGGYWEDQGYEWYAGI